MNEQEDSWKSLIIIKKVESSMAPPLPFRIQLLLGRSQSRSSLVLICTIGENKSRPSLGIIWHNLNTKAKQKHQNMKVKKSLSFNGACLIFHITTKKELCGNKFQYNEFGRLSTVNVC